MLSSVLVIVVVVVLALFLLRFIPLIIAIALIVVVAVFVTDAVKGGTAYLQLFARVQNVINQLADVVLRLLGQRR